MNERLLQVIDYLIYSHCVKSRADFGKKIGKSSSQVTDMLKGVKPISVKTIHNICEYFSGLDEEWLRTGNGQMLKSSVSVGDGNSGVVVNGNNNNSPIDNRHYYSDSPDVLKAQIDLLDERIKEKDAQIKEKDAQIKKLLEILAK